jgi:plasmid maintenance system antidote protein VapI
MRVLLSEICTLRELLDARGITTDAAAVLAGLDTATISRICSGQARAKPLTIVRLSMALGINARRMARLCDQAWNDRAERVTDNTAEILRQVDIDALADTR